MIHLNNESESMLIVRRKFRRVCVCACVVAEAQLWQPSD